MSWLKVISYGLVYSQTIFFFNSFSSYKNDYYWFNREELVEQAKNKYQNGGGKKSNWVLYCEERRPEIKSKR